MSDEPYAMDAASWRILDQGAGPLQELGLEARLAIGNGFLGVRGASAIDAPGQGLQPRTFIAGLFDAPDILPPVPALVTGPPWAGVTVLIDGEPLVLGAPGDLVPRRILDMRRGVLAGDWAGDADGPIAHVAWRRLVSQADRAIGLESLDLTFGRPVQIVVEAMVEEGPSELDLIGQFRGGGTWRTWRSGKGLALSTAATLTLGADLLAPCPGGGLGWRWRWTTRPGQVANLRLWAAFARADRPGVDPGPLAKASLDRVQALGWAAAVSDHEAAWDERWRCCDVEVEGDEDAQRALRFAAYHLNSAANPDDALVSIGARALTGEAYRGHVFWDTEIFLLPFFTLTWPAAARAMLMYRFHTLGGARDKAARMGWRGAFYAWESADTGQETTPEQVVGADGACVAVWTGREEEHVTADVAYAVWAYWKTTGDEDFLLSAGAEIVLETARFWSSRVQLEADGIGHLRDVVGPDEYHEHIDDNAFTNQMARWNLQRGVELAELLRARWPARWAELSESLALNADELDTWPRVAAALTIARDPKTGLIEQFAGFFALEAIDLAPYADRTTSMDAVLGRERIGRSQVVKQADLVALLALLPELFDKQTQGANFDYYAPRCDHGSSLSPAMHAMVAARLGKADLALAYFRQAAAIDLGEPVARSAGGIHIATQGGLWQAAVFGFAGIALREDWIGVDPVLPAGWSALVVRLQWRGRRLKIRIERSGGWVIASLEAGPALDLVIRGDRHRLPPGVVLRVADGDPSIQAA